VTQARPLGIQRAIYRWIHEYGIVMPQRVVSHERAVFAEFPSPGGNRA
jgi:hypothetical protein